MARRHDQKIETRYLKNARDMATWRPILLLSCIRTWSIIVPETWWSQVRVIASYSNSVCCRCQTHGPRNLVVSGSSHRVLFKLCLLSVSNTWAQKLGGLRFESEHPIQTLSALGVHALPCFTVYYSIHSKFKRKKKKKYHCDMERLGRNA